RRASLFTSPSRRKPCAPDEQRFATNRPKILGATSLFAFGGHKKDSECSPGSDLEPGDGTPALAVTEASVFHQALGSWISLAFVMQGLLTVSKPPSGSGFQARGSGPSSARGPGNLYRPTNPQGAGVQKTSTPPPPIRVRASAAHVDAHGAASYHTPAHRDEGYQGPRSLSVNDSPFQFKFLLPDAVTGAAVGRNGSTVNAIKQQTGTFMQGATTYPTERLLIFASPSVASAAAALRVLLDCLAAVPGALERLAPRPGSPELALRIVIPGHCAGAVMGPGGETIKALGARCGCHAAVEPRPPRAAFVPFRAVALAAPGPAALAAGAAEVMDLVTRDPRYAPGIQAVTSTCFRMLPVAERRVGALLGPAGAHIRALQDVLRVRMGVEDGADLAGVKHVSFWGPVENVDVAMRA
ncbi:hypothetical protein APUTEX25_001132, partial [Auxenochlorella protothecoides]